MSDIRRREFISLVGGGAAAAWPLGASAQQQATPVIGFVSSASASPSSAAVLLNPLRQGLEEGGYVEGRNLVIEYRWAGDRADRLPELVADLIGRRVALIVAGGFEATMAVKAATQSVPILFIAGFDPVKMGLVASINRPGGNATGVSVYTIELLQKRLELLLRMVPKTDTVAVLVHPNPYGSELEIENMEEAARAHGLKLLVLKTSVEGDLEAAFASAVQQGAGALALSADPFFMPRHAKIVALAARYELPTVYPWRIYVEGGGLMSYGPTIAWAYHQIGLYASRILKGTKPNELPVQLPPKFELVINPKTVKALGLTVPPTLLALADEVIE